LTVAKIYTTLSILNIIRLPIAVIPLTLASGAEAMRSLNRIKKFLNNPEIEGVPKMLPVACCSENESEVRNEDVLVALHNASFSWNDAGANIDEVSQERVENEGIQLVSEKQGDNNKHDVVLKHVNLTIKKGELMAVVGSVGSGKSSLLCSILGQLRRTKGHQMLNADVAYVGQEHWIQVQKRSM
jgi:ATP-binding cassette, subfamily C (CFTR/MRP), member 1